MYGLMMGVFTSSVFILQSATVSTVENTASVMLPCFRINDRVISANSVSLEGVDYATAVQVSLQMLHSSPNCPDKSFNCNYIFYERNKLLQATNIYY